MNSKMKLINFGLIRHFQFANFDLNFFDRFDLVIAIEMVIPEIK